MRYATRTFIWSFVPFALLLGGSFATIHWMIESTVRSGVRDSLTQAHESMAKVRKNSDIQESRFLRIVGENPALKNGVQLLLANPGNGEAQRTVVDQLREICEQLKFDYLLVSNPEGRPLVGVLRINGALMAVDIARQNPPSRGLWPFDDRRTYQVNSIDIEQGDEILAKLSVGENFSLDDFSTPVVLLHEGKVLKTSLPGQPSALAVESALRQAGDKDEVMILGETYLTLPTDKIDFGDGYVLRAMQNVDSANGRVQGVLSKVFLITGLGAILAALVITGISSRSIVRPIAGVVESLKESELTGLLPMFEASGNTIQEIRELTQGFNRAGFAIREAREKLQSAYVEFVGSLAGALDARDPYTAGHSRRVSEYSCMIAEALHFADDQLEEIRVGALLHDLGKIGIADSVLRKPGRLSPEEFALLKEHTSIGRRILEGVAGFHDYLPVIELHHENWDGTGYPHGMRGEDVPLFARIVHVADAYDAMTSDRPYRRGFSHEYALAELFKFSGTQFDPAIVTIFTKLTFPLTGERRPSSGNDAPPQTGIRLV